MQNDLKDIRIEQEHARMQILDHTIDLQNQSKAEPDASFSQFYDEFAANVDQMENPRRETKISSL